MILFFPESCTQQHQKKSCTKPDLGAAINLFTKKTKYNIGTMFTFLLQIMKHENTEKKLSNLFLLLPPPSIPTPISLEKKIKIRLHKGGWMRTGAVKC